MYIYTVDLQAKPWEKKKKKNVLKERSLAEKGSKSFDSKNFFKNEKNS